MESPILSVAKETFSKMLLILEAKGKDYAKDTDPYQNFRLAERLLNIPTKKGITVRLLEKVSRICNLLEKESDVKDETIEDTINDLIGLAIVLKAHLREGKTTVKIPEPQEGCIRPVLTIDVSKTTGVAEMTPVTCTAPTTFVSGDMFVQQSTSPYANAGAFEDDGQPD